MATRWLDRLADATTYAELQGLFDEIAATARQTAEPHATAAAIREAVVRVERERERDAQALQAFEQDYAAFREDQRGLMGWLKRHLPFSETRRREKTHKSALADQRAEVLGDSLVIARAQMLCEHLLPAEARTMGLKASEWQAVLAADDAPARVGAYAASVATLERDLERGRGFVDAVRADIDAFADARFASEDDERRRRADVEAARAEVAMFADELESLTRVRTQACEHMRAVVRADLAAQDPAFAHMERDVPRLRTALAAGAAALDVLEELHESASDLEELEERLRAEPKQRRELEERVATLRRETEEAARHAANADAELAGPQSRYEQAVQAEQRARAAVRRAQDELSALLERTGQYELEPGQSLGDATPADAALTRAQADLQTASAELHAAERPCEQAQALAEHARKRTRDLERQLARAHRDLEAVGDRFAGLRRAFDRRREEVRPVLDRLPELARRYAGAMRDVERRSALPDDPDGLRPPQRFEVPGFALGDDESDVERAAAHWQHLAGTLESEKAALARDLAAQEAECDARWRRHAEALLGPEAARRL